MNDRQLYAQILGVSRPWTVSDVALRLEESEVLVRVDCGKPALVCPECGRPSPRHDKRRRRWRHLDTCQLQTIVEADVPRVNCTEHGVKQVSVPWAEQGSKLTAMLEALILKWLSHASIQAVADQFEMAWSTVKRVMERAVERGLSRRVETPAVRIGVDETSFRKRHDYVTVVTDLDTCAVLHVSDGKSAESLASFYESRSPAERERIQTVTMDMSAAFIRATRTYVPQAEDKIAFDRFHVAKLLGDAVNKIRREENKELVSEGDRRLVGTRFLWIQAAENIDAKTWRDAFRPLRESILRTARAWSLKEEARLLWHYKRRGWALRGWKTWITRALRSRLEPMKKAACTIRDHLWGIVNAAVTGESNASVEALNAGIQRLKHRACGYRNREAFRTAILFHFGGLDMRPVGAFATHTN